MAGFLRRDRDALERALRAARPEAPEELVRELADRAAPRPGGARRGGGRLLAAAALTALAAAAVGGLGGFGLALEGARAAASAAAQAAAGPPPPVTICHATGSAANPYVEITIATAGLAGHAGHENDIIPAPPGGCPPAAPPPGPPSPPPPGSGDRITICHATGSATNPYVEITIATAGLAGHAGHENDIIPAPPEGCPGPTPGDDQYRPGRGCGDPNHVHFRQGQCPPQAGRP